MHIGLNQWKSNPKNVSKVCSRTSERDNVVCFLNPDKKSANFLLMPSRLGCTFFRMTKRLFCLGISIVRGHHRVQCSRTLMLCKKSITAENICKFIHTVQSTCKLDPYGLIVDVIAWIWIASFLVAPTV